jgi:membrane protease YdiL (CAAX protease family)
VNLKVNQISKFTLLLRLVLTSLFLAVALAEAYFASQRLVGNAATPPWMISALVNTLLAFVVLGIWKRNGHLKELLSIGRSLWPYLPSLVVLLGSLGLIAASRLLIPDESRGGAAFEAGIPWAWVTWVPIIEELVFRVGIGQYMRRVGGVFWGSWFSAVTFALVHASPTLAKLSVLEIGLPLGPFFLGLACEALFVRTGKLWPVVLLHVVCNATVPLFSLLDDRWLGWLSLLYT